MGGTERIVHIRIGEGRKLLRKTRIVLFLFRMEPEILQAHNEALVNPEPGLEKAVVDFLAAWVDIAICGRDLLAHDFKHTALAESWARVGDAAFVAWGPALVHTRLNPTALKAVIETCKLVVKVK